MSDHEHSLDPLKNHGYTNMCSCGAFYDEGWHEPRLKRAIEWYQEGERDNDFLCHLANGCIARIGDLEASNAAMRGTITHQTRIVNGDTACINELKADLNALKKLYESRQELVVELEAANERANRDYYKAEEARYDAVKELLQAKDELETVNSLLDMKREREQHWSDEAWKYKESNERLTRLLRDRDALVERAMEDSRIAAISPLECLELLARATSLVDAQLRAEDTEVELATTRLGEAEAISMLEDAEARVIRTEAALAEKTTYANEATTARQQAEFRLDLEIGMRQEAEAKFSRIRVSYPIVDEHESRLEAESALTAKQDTLDDLAKTTREYVEYSEAALAERDRLLKIAENRLSNVTVRTACHLESWSQGICADVNNTLADLRARAEEVSE